MVPDWNKGRFIHELTGPYSNYLREFAAEHEVRVCEVNPKKSANFAKVLENRSKTDTIDAKTLYAFHALVTEQDFCIPEIDEIAEQLGARFGSYEITQKTRTMFSNHVHSLEHKGELGSSRKTR